MILKKPNYLKNSMKKVIFFAAFVLGIMTNAHSQYSQYTGTSDTIEYPYFFPLLGQRAMQEGFDIPYPLGLMVNSFYATQSMLIDNIEIGSGTRGPVTERIQSAFFDIVEGKVPDKHGWFTAVQ